MDARTVPAVTEGTPPGQSEEELEAGVAGRRGKTRRAEIKRHTCASSVLKAVGDQRKAILVARLMNQEYLRRSVTTVDVDVPHHLLCT